MLRDASRRWGWILALGALSVVAGCSADQPTQLILALATDLRIPTDIDAVDLRVERSGQTRWSSTLALDPALASSIELPATLALNPGADLSLPVLVEVTARRGEREVVTRRASVKFRAGQILLLRLELLRSCAERSTPCPGEQTCVDGGCQPVSLEDLPEYSSEAAFAALDAGTPADAGVDIPAGDGPAPMDGPVADRQRDVGPRDVAADNLIPVDHGPDSTADLPLHDLAQPDSSSCGDQTKNGSDDCDDVDFGGETCISLGFTGGTLRCTGECKYDLSGCQTPGFVLVDATKLTFQMGTTATAPCFETNEPRHGVTLTRPYEIAQHEVTQAAYHATTGHNPSFFSASGGGPDCGVDCPVETVSWELAVDYCNRLSAAAGMLECYSCTGAGASLSCTDAAAYEGKQIYDCPGYRLPTEAEWENAYRAGSSTDIYPSAGNSGSTGNPCGASPGQTNAELIGWCAQNSGAMPHPVGQKAANAWGLYDMAGNLWEYCHDWYLEDLGTQDVTDPVGTCSYNCLLRVERGGAFEWGYTYMRAATRAWGSKGDRSTGFRCARTRSE